MGCTGGGRNKSELAVELEELSLCKERLELRVNGRYNEKMWAVYLWEEGRGEYEPALQKKVEIAGLCNGRVKVKS